MISEQPANAIGNPEAASGGDASAGSAQGADRRQFRRLRPDEITPLDARLTSGAEIRLIDLSRGGAQFECDRRFLPNSSVSLRLNTSDAAFVVTGRVVRSRIVRLPSGGLGYNVAVAFSEQLQSIIDEADVPAATPAPSPQTSPVEASAPRAMPPAVIEPHEGPALIEDRDERVTAEEQAAFEAMVEPLPAMLTVTASVPHTGDELCDIFNGNDW